MGFGQILTDLLKKTLFPAQSLTNQRASFFFHYYARTSAGTESVLLLQSENSILDHFGQSIHQLQLDIWHSLINML